jgi:hypothetical protein
MVKNNTTYFQPWDRIHESNPVEILQRHEQVTLVPMLVMQGALDDNMIPPAQKRFAETYKAAAATSGTSYSRAASTNGWRRKGRRPTARGRW